MSTFPDPPLRDKDRASKVWDNWFLKVSKKFPEKQAYIGDVTPPVNITSFAEVEQLLGEYCNAINLILDLLEAAKIMKGVSEE
jgi:hypothetical protein